MRATIRKKKKGGYETDAYFGRGSDGKRIRKHLTAPTRAKLEEKIARWEEEYKNLSNPSDITWGEYSKNYVALYKQEVNQNTKDMYKYALANWEDLDHLQLNEIRTDDIQKIVNRKAKDKHYASIDKMKMTINQIFRRAVNEGIIIAGKNPCNDVQWPKQKKKVKEEDETEKRPLSNEEIAALQKILPTLPENLQCLITLLYYFGMRPQEVVAITTDRIDLEEKTIKINSAIEWVNNKPNRKETKSGKSSVNPIPEAAVPLLEQFIANAKGKKLLYMEDGDYLTKSRLYDNFEKIKQALEAELHHRVEPGFSMYTFRHNYATRVLYYEGVKPGRLSLKGAAYLMRHTENVFVQVYAHLLNEVEDYSSIVNTIKQL